MPLSEKGEEIKKKFKKKYGEEGEGYFYAKERKDKKFASIVKHGGLKSLMK